MPLIKVAVSLAFNGSGYVGKPYWAELDQIIRIEREVHPKLGPAKKEASLLASCEKAGITIQRYHELKELAARPFYTRDGLRDGEIIIPQRIYQSFLNHTSMQAPKSIPKISEKGLTFVGVTVDGGFFNTMKTLKDAQKFERFVKNQESNQRQFSSDPYIDNFTATGILRVDEEVIKCQDLQKLTEYGGHWYGMGSSRNQGFGRFTVTQWEKF